MKKSEIESKAKGMMVGNISTVWRNKEKEDVISAMIDNNESIDEIMMTTRNSEDARVMIRKQRFTGATDNKKQWFKSESKRYVSHYDDNGDFAIETE